MDLIVIKQLPVIEERLKSISAEIDEKLAFVGGLIVSEENVKEMKSIRAALNKDFEQDWEMQRKAFKAAYMEPFARIDELYKGCVANPYKAAVASLDAKIKDVEGALKARKTDEVRAYFNEYAASCGVGAYADFGRQMSDIRMSDTASALRRICRERIDPLVGGLAAIDAQPEELRAEILAEFKRTLKAAEAITIVAERHKAIAEQQKAREGREARQAAESEAATRAEAAAAASPHQPLAPPTQVSALGGDPVLKMTFPPVTGPRTKLRELKMIILEFCKNNPDIIFEGGDPK